MSERFLVYGWRCPFCSQTRTSLTAADRATIEGQAANAFRNHVKNTGGGGHGGHGDFPPGFDPCDAFEHVEVEPAWAGEPVENAPR